MKLHFMDSPEEKIIHDVVLKDKTVTELMNLVKDIQTKYYGGVLENDVFVNEALVQIALELGSRCE